MTADATVGGGSGARLLEVMVQLDDTLVVEPLHHLKLAVVVAAVEHDLLNGDLSAVAALLTRPPHHAEGAVADDLLHPVPPTTALPHLHLQARTDHEGSGLGWRRTLGGGSRACRRVSSAVRTSPVGLDDDDMARSFFAGTHAHGVTRGGPYFAGQER